MNFSRYLIYLNERLENESPLLTREALKAVEEAYSSQKDILHLIKKIDNKKVHILAFRGTSNLEHVKRLLNFSLKDWDGHQMYSGFVDHFNTIKEELKEHLIKIKDQALDSPQEILFVGHSLGAVTAALAYLFAGSQGKLFMFGVPKMGEKSFYDKLLKSKPQFHTQNNIHFVVLTHNNHFDPVSQIPKFIPKLISDKEFLDEFKQFINVLVTQEDSLGHMKLHSMKNYSNSVNQFVKQKEKSSV